MALRAILFDLDGTLRKGLEPGDFERMCAVTARHLAPVAGWDGGDEGAALIRDFWNAWVAEGESLPDYRTPDSRAILRSSFAARGLDLTEDVTAECWRVMHEDAPREFGMTLFDDTLPTLARLREAGIATAIVSNSSASAEHMRPFLLEYGIAPDVVISSANVGYRKPHRMVYSRALQTLGMPASDAIMVGDNFENDVLGAQAFGIRGILKTNGRTPTPNDANTADHVISALSDLFDLPIWQHR